MKETLSLPTSVTEINDLHDELLTDDIIRYVPSIVQNEWQTYKLYKNRKYYIISRNIKNNAHSFFLERDWYKYQLEKCDYTIQVIKNHFVNAIAVYMIKDPELVKRLKYIYNSMMDYLHKDKKEYEDKLKSIDY
jgi:hypothetical protein